MSKKGQCLPVETVITRVLFSPRYPPLQSGLLQFALFSQVWLSWRHHGPGFSRAVLQVTGMALFVGPVAALIRE